MNWAQFKEVSRIRTKPLVVAHRGVPVSEPENTLKSFQLALEQGANVLETDLRFTKDNEIVLVHDATLERTTNGIGLVRDHTYAEIREYQTRTVDGEIGYEKVPTLTDLIEFVNGEVPLLLELKDPLFTQHEYARRLVEILFRLEMADSVALISFDYIRVKRVKELNKTIPGGYITAKNPFPVRNAELSGPWWPLLMLNPTYVALAHRLGSVVCPLDPYPETRMMYYKTLGVDAVLSNNTESTIKAIG